MTERSAEAASAARAESGAQDFGFAALGAVAGGIYAAVIHAQDARMIGTGLVALLLVFVTCGFGSFFAQAAEIAPRRAAWRAGLHAAVVTGLTAWCLSRYPQAEGFFGSVGPFLALCTLALLPIPFLITQATRGRWLDYPALTQAAWGTLMRGAAALFFMLILWLAILLVTQVLKIVGLGVIAETVSGRTMVFLISGLAFGLAVAMVRKLKIDLSPDLLVGMLRLLLPVVALGSVLFVAAALLRGFERGLAGLSPASLLLGMAPPGILLITMVVDSDEERSATARVLRLSALVMTGLLPVLSLLSVVAVWQRIAAQGLTPNRLLVLVLALLSLAYALAYLAALLRGKAWQAGVRAANMRLALLVVAVAGLWMTPFLNAERLSAQSQLAAFVSGRKAPEDFRHYEFRELGFAGEAALRALEEQARARGNDALLAAVEGRGSVMAPPIAREGEEGQRQTALQRLAEVMPLQPQSATGTRDSLLTELDLSTLLALQRACEQPLEDGRAGCVMVVADLLPDLPGEEAVVIAAIAQSHGLHERYFESYAILFDAAQRVEKKPLRHSDGSWISDETLASLLRSWQEAPPR